MSVTWLGVGGSLVGRLWQHTGGWQLEIIRLNLIRLNCLSIINNWGLIYWKFPRKGSLRGTECVSDASQVQVSYRLIVNRFLYIHHLYKPLYSQELAHWHLLSRLVLRLELEFRYLLTTAGSLTALMRFRAWIRVRWAFDVHLGCDVLLVFTSRYIVPKSKYDSEEKTRISGKVAQAFVFFV